MIKHPKSVLITGGTRGLGKEIGLAYASLGATVYLTYKWGLSDLDELKAEFKEKTNVIPHFIECDVADNEANQHLFDYIKKESVQLDVLISNVAFSKVLSSIDDLKKNSFYLSLDYSAWPIVEMTKLAKKCFSAYPKYVLAISSDGPDICHPNYDFAGVSKSVLETFCKYLSMRLGPLGSTVNAIRPGFLDTDSSRATFGGDVIDNIKHRFKDLFLDPKEVASVCVAFTSGLMDSVNGQILTVDKSASHISPISYLTKRQEPTHGN